MNENAEPRYLTIDEVCKLMHISDVTLWKLRKEGQFIQPSLVGRRCLFDRYKIEAFLDANQMTAAA